MIATPQDMRGLTSDLSASAWTLAAIGALFESGLFDQLREASTLDELAAGCRGLSRARIERCLGVVVAAGVVVADGARYRLAEGAMGFLQEPMRAALLGDIRSTLMQSVALLDASAGAEPVTGWQHTDPGLLQAQGDASGAFAPMFKTMIVPSLGDLATRLEQPGGRFLDVGVGVGALSISMCRAWPNLRAVGLDVFDAPLAIARQNISRAELGDRIELRRVAVEDLPDDAAFDLAWLPSFFIPAPRLPAASQRVCASLRPGGWMILCALGGGDDRKRAVSALISDVWGGPALSPTAAESLLKEAGLSSVRTLPGPPWAPVLVIGQR